MLLFSFVWEVPTVVLVISSFWCFPIQARIWTIVSVFFFPTLLGTRFFLSNHLKEDWSILVCSIILFCWICRLCYIQSLNMLSLTVSDLQLRHQLFIERQEHQKIMRSLMPPIVAEHVLLTGQTPLYCKYVTVGFIKMSFFHSRSLSKTNPTSNSEHKVKDTDSIIKLLHRAIMQFDSKIAPWEPLVTKIEHVQNCYLICGGILTPKRKKNHAEAVIRVSLEFQKAIDEINKKSRVTCVTTIGIHTGFVIGTIIGTSRKFFRIFGDTVNTASRVCTTGMAGEIQISTTTFAERNVSSSFDSSPRTPVFMKGKGMMKTYIIHQVSSSVLRQSTSMNTTRANSRAVSLSRHANRSISAKNIINSEDSITTSTRILPSIHWRHAEMEGIEQSGNDLLSMNFYQFLNTAQARANKFTLKFPKDNDNLSDDINSMNPIAMPSENNQNNLNVNIKNTDNHTSKLASLTRQFFGTSMLNATTTNKNVQNTGNNHTAGTNTNTITFKNFRHRQFSSISTEHVTKQQTTELSNSKRSKHESNTATGSNQSTFETRFVNYIREKWMKTQSVKMHFMFFLCLNMVMTLSLWNEGFSICIIASNKPTHCLIYTVPYTVVIFLQFLYVKKIFIKSFEALHFVNYSHLVVRMLFNVFNVFNLQVQVHLRDYADNMGLDLFFASLLIMGFFNDLFRFYQITPIGFSLIFFSVIKAIFVAYTNSWINVIGINLYLFCICVAIKYRTEKNSRKNLVYQMAIEFSKIDRDEATSILIPHFIAKLLMNKASLSDSKLLSRKFNNATVFQSDIVGMLIIDILTFIVDLKQYAFHFVFSCF